MLKRIFPIIVVVSAVVLTLFSTPYAGEKPEVVRHDATYLDRGVSIVVQWQSVNPVTRVVISAGREQKEIKVDEYDNRRNAYGYSGEVSVLVPLEAVGFGQPAAPFQYTVQLEDDLRLRSDVISGKVAPPVVAGGGMPPPSPYGMMPPSYGMAPPPQQGNDGWGQSHLNANVTTQQQQPQGAGSAVGGIMDKLVSTMERHDVAPTMDRIKVNVLSSGTVSFTSKAIDDKGLREVKFKVLDAKGMQVQEQIFSNLGKSWEGTTQTFQLGGGAYRVIAQAIDSAGNTSKEQSENFNLSGPPVSAQQQSQPQPLPEPSIQPPVVAQPPPVVMQPPPVEIAPPPVVMPPPPTTVMPPPPVVMPPPPIEMPPPPVPAPPPPVVMPPPPVEIPPPPVVMQPPPAVTCPTGLVMCGGNCFDLRTDLNNCGRCDGACSSGYSCVNGACTPPPPQSAIQPPSFPLLPGMEDNVDRGGSDYRSFNLPAADPKLCSSACESETQCKAYTFVRPGVQGPHARCWLKTDVPHPTNSTCCISGVKAQSQSQPAIFPLLPGMEDNIDRPGMDYRSFDLPAADPKLCSSACESEAQCRAYTFVRPGVQGSQARCWLKSDVPNPGNSTCCISGVKAQSQLQPGNISGRWESTEGMISFSQSGNYISALYSQDNGHITATINDNILDGYWFENSSAQRCASPQTNRDGQSTYYWGRVRFQFKVDSFAGGWGYCDSVIDHNWNGSRLK